MRVKTFRRSPDVEGTAGGQEQTGVWVPSVFGEGEGSVSLRFSPRACGIYRYGEKAELAEELKMDIEDLKVAFRAQQQQLLLLTSDK